MRHSCCRSGAWDKWQKVYRHFGRHWIWVRMVSRIFVCSAYRLSTSVLCREMFLPGSDMRVTWTAQHGSLCCLAKRAEDIFRDIKSSFEFAVIFATSNHRRSNYFLALHALGDAETRRTTVINFSIPQFRNNCIVSLTLCLWTIFLLISEGIEILTWFFRPLAWMLNHLVCLILKNRSWYGSAIHLR